jgi:tRNA G18 (ribose-2'-O)-methylase SpoU
MNRKKLTMSDLNRLDVEAFKKSEKLPVVVVLDNVRSMNNIGSVFRTCDAFRIDAVFLCGITAKPPHKDIEKTALGATESVNWHYFESTKSAVEKLIADNYNVYAIEQVENSIFLTEIEKKKEEKIALVFGNEVMGVEQKIVNNCHGCIEIPQFGTKHSLNIAVSAGIVLWHVLYLYNKGL